MKKELRNTEGEMYYSSGVVFIANTKDCESKGVYKEWMALRAQGTVNNHSPLMMKCSDRVMK